MTTINKQDAQIEWEKKRFALKIAPYRQTLPNSCGAACLLMALHWLDQSQFSLCADMEHVIYRATMYWEGETVTYPGMAKYALLSGFGAKMYVRSAVPNCPYYLSESDYAKFMQVYKRHRAEALKLGMEEIIHDFNLYNLIQDDVKSGHPVIILARLDSHEMVLHNILIRGHDSNKVLIIDPLSGNNRTFISFLEDKINLSFFKVALALQPKKM
jgi:predicted double-glycine peptidase